MTREQSRPMPKERLERLRRWSHLLDNVFRVPGTRLRFGWDSLLGLIPGLGDALTTLLSGTILIHAFRFQVPRVIQVRMLLNVVIDVLVGAVPVLGDALILHGRPTRRTSNCWSVMHWRKGAPELATGFSLSS